MPITTQDLINAGYRPYRSDKPGECYYQKAIRSEGSSEVLYFINVTAYAPVGMWAGGYDAEVVLYRNETDPALRVRADIVTLADTERTFADVYHELRCIPDIHNND